MKSLRFFLILAASAVITLFLNSCGGGVKVDEGDLGFLRGVTYLNVQYDYSQMGVGKFDAEQDYINKKVEEYNDKESGQGDVWLQSWKNARATFYQPRFEDAINDQLSDVGCKVSAGKKDAKYTMILKTVFTEPGYNIVISRKHASIDVEVIFVETGSTTILAKLIMNKIPGRTFGGNDYDVATRLSEAYAKCGKDLGKSLKSAFLE